MITKLSKNKWDATKSFWVVEIPKATVDFTSCLSGCKTKWNLRHVSFQWMKLPLFYQAAMASPKLLLSRTVVAWDFFYVIISFPKTKVSFSLLFPNFAPKVCFNFISCFLYPDFWRKRDLCSLTVYACACIEPLLTIFDLAQFQHPLTERWKLLSL